MLRMDSALLPAALLDGLPGGTREVELEVNHPPGTEGYHEVWYVGRWANGAPMVPEVAALTDNGEAEARRCSEQWGPGEYRLVTEDGRDLAAWTAGLGGDSERV